ncbi:MAG: DUF1553 domain-containing protein [Akkermansiaceae bacterium]|nr:DUF1553 domain-containing protein [Akkermansiaceae bacterium]
MNMHSFCLHIILYAGLISLSSHAADSGSNNEHWSFLPVKRSPLPVDPNQPIDSFLERKLKDKRVKPNPKATPISLIKRVSIILTGLPPNPNAVSSFLTSYEKDPQSSYEELVDRLLSSKRFGERWAQHWLDVIRWAETNGSESNLYRNMSWIYRDYVIRSFNEDLPYNQFVKEQLAGDLFGKGDATGFLVSGSHVPAATVGQIPEAIRQARADRMDEVIQTVTSSLLGLTMNCARCHDHKFDPLTIKDYYSLVGVFQDIEFGSRSPEYASDHPVAIVASKILTSIKNHRIDLVNTGPWEEDWGGYKDAFFEPVKTQSVRIQFKTPYVAIDELEIYGPDSTEDNFALASVGSKVQGPEEMATRGRSGVNRINDGEYGTMVWRAKAPKGSKDKPWAIVTFAEPKTINSLRLSSNREYYYETDYLTLKSKLQFSTYQIQILKPDGSWKTVFSTHRINQLNETNVQRKSILKKLNLLIAEFSEKSPRPSFIGRFIKPEVSYILERGSPESPGNEVNPAAPDLFKGNLGLDNKSEGTKRRKLFAEWITSPHNPLLARVMVNRLWQNVFGKGIVTTASDFGNAGTEPTHPELLDWLSSEFMSPQTIKAKPWSIKSMIRLMVLSEAFQRSSSSRDESINKDSINSLLWRYEPKRVDAEVIRDSILKASGKLSTTVGGRSYRIHNVKKTYAQWEVINNYGDQTWRRMIYQERMRRVDDHLFSAFDFPDCGQVRGKRPVSTTPLQALNLLNSKFITEQASIIAKKCEDETNDMSSAVRLCFELLLNRNPENDEFQFSLKLAQSDGLRFVCRALINSNEFVFIP